MKKLTKPFRCLAQLKVLMASPLSETCPVAQPLEWKFGVPKILLPSSSTKEADAEKIKTNRKQSYVNDFPLLCNTGMLHCALCEHYDGSLSREIRVYPNFTATIVSTLHQGHT